MAFFGLLKKKQKFDDRPIDNSNNNIVMNDPNKPDPIAQMMASMPDVPDNVAQSTMKTYDIIVFDPNPDGTKKQKMVNGVKAHSPRELATLYAADGSQIQIIKEYGAEQATASEEKKANIAPAISLQSAAVDKSPSQASYSTKAIQHIKEPPKFFEIGGVKCKLEDGKMFQEQWVRVDAAKYRLVADTTNKLVSMNGKHLEMLKWIQIEDEGNTENA